MGFLPARSAAIARVGATVERGAALYALQPMSGHDEILWLFLTASNRQCDGPAHGATRFHLQAMVAYPVRDPLLSKRIAGAGQSLGNPHRKMV